MQLRSVAYSKNLVLEGSSNLVVKVKVKMKKRKKKLGKNLLAQKVCYFFKPCPILLPNFESSWDESFGV